MGVKMVSTLHLTTGLSTIRPITHVQVCKDLIGCVRHCVIPRGQQQVEVPDDSYMKYDIMSLETLSCCEYVPHGEAINFTGQPKEEMIPSRQDKSALLTRSWRRKCWEPNLYISYNFKCFTCLPSIIERANLLNLRGIIVSMQIRICLFEMKTSVHLCWQNSFST